METSDGNRACSQRVTSGNQQTDGGARPTSGKAKAELLETQFLCLNNQGARKLSETRTEDVYPRFLQRRVYSLASSQRGRRHVKGTNGSLNHLPMEEEAKRRSPTSGELDRATELP